VRGGSYNADKVKVSSGPSLFKLLAIDLFEVPEATRNIANHPRNRVHMALQRGDPAWVFVINIMVPGPPFLSFVAYFQVISLIGLLNKCAYNCGVQGDRALIDADTPFGRIARPFFYGNNDELRNNRFKLIPKILDGNLIIKMAVKDTPTLLGNKLKQYYFKVCRVCCLGLTHRLTCGDEAGGELFRVRCGRGVVKCGAQYCRVGNGVLEGDRGGHGVLLAR